MNEIVVLACMGEAYVNQYGSRPDRSKDFEASGAQSQTRPLDQDERTCLEKLGWDVRPVLDSAISVPVFGRRIAAAMDRAVPQGRIVTAMGS
ncbi:MAG: hypothetical protein CMJ67_04055 [Planctomycetaceae bacterium]|nr:hypothetical protein [Planctomycetaceae bacterium]